jgi:hypothetical protein
VLCCAVLRCAALQNHAMFARMLGTCQSCIHWSFEKLLSSACNLCSEMIIFWAEMAKQGTERSAQMHSSLIVSFFRLRAQMTFWQLMHIDSHFFSLFLLRQMGVSLWFSLCGARRPENTRQASITTA